MKSLGTSLLLPLKDFLSKRAYKGRKVFNNIFFFFLPGRIFSLALKSLKALSLLKKKKKKKKMLPNYQIQLCLKIKRQQSNMTHIIIAYVKKSFDGHLSIFQGVCLPNGRGDLDILISQLKYRKCVCCHHFQDSFSSLCSK